jgi:tetratricopeptide (TPR) repeat protein
MKCLDPTPLAGIRYYTPPGDAILSGFDGRVRIPYGDLPIPLLELDFYALGGAPPSYDAIGRGIYQALRTNPDCTFGERYAQLLKEAYPHFLAELASHTVILDKKDVDVAYLDRKITYMKIFALIEPDNPQLPLEIGLALLNKGMDLSALDSVTSSLYQSQDFLERALELSPASVAARHHLGEVSYLLGKYDAAASLWRGILTALPADEAQKLEERLVKMAEGRIPRVPVVDYLEAVRAAFDCYQKSEWEEAAAILHDVLDDEVFRTEFPLPELWQVLGICCTKLMMPRYAKEYLRQALELDPTREDARQALESLHAWGYQCSDTV